MNNMAAPNYPPDSPDETSSGRAAAAPREPGFSPPVRERVFEKVLTWTRWLLTALTVVYCVGFLVILYLLEYQAEEFTFLSTAMYLPPWGWLVPLVPLAFFSLLIYARLLIFQVACIPVMIFGFMDLRWHGWPPPSKASFRIVTNNIGQSHKTSYKAFAEQQRADLIALQDAGMRGPEIAREYPDRYVVGKDQFVLISKFPVKAAGALPMPDPEDPRQKVAAWFEVEAHGGQSIIVFVVHMPTPRDQLNAMKGLGAVSVLLGKEGGHGADIRKQNESFFKTQQELANQMVSYARQAKVPFIVCGDFNIPTHGKIYRTYRDNWIEAFNERGQGVGATFPGDAHLPAWLRLDNIYCSKTGLRPIHAEVEEERVSQHRCMAATFEITGIR